MKPKVSTSEKARVDIRLTKEQKDLFELATSLGKFHTLTEFVIFSIQESAQKIIQKHNMILASQQDKDIFFQAILSPKKPNASLTKAAARYKKATE